MIQLISFVKARRRHPANVIPSGVSDVPVAPLHGKSNKPLSLWTKSLYLPKNVWLWEFRSWGICVISERTNEVFRVRLFTGGWALYRALWWRDARLWASLIGQRQPKQHVLITTYWWDWWVVMTNNIHSWFISLSVFILDYTKINFSTAFPYSSWDYMSNSL